tara:strand:+ start:1957 stop:2604 length:648 start_codon:yes stop_codon:yes gene_type:complete
MTENLYNVQYDITKKSKIRRFYDSNKIYIFSFTFLVIILITFLSFYFEKKESKRTLLSDNYVKAKIHLENKNKSQAVNLLKEVIFSDDPTYSTLSFFLILDQDLITDQKEILSLFEHILKNNDFDQEVKNLLIYKKSLLISKRVDESELLKNLKPILNSDSLWRPHAILLLGDFFTEKKEYLKAKEFYMQILSTKDLQKDFYEHARSQISAISNE